MKTVPFAALLVHLVIGRLQIRTCLRSTPPSFPRGSVFSDTITQTSNPSGRNSDTKDVEPSARFPRAREHEAAIRSLREPHCSWIPFSRFRICGQEPFVGNLDVVTTIYSPHRRGFLRFIWIRRISPSDETTLRHLGGREGKGVVNTFILS